MTAQLTNPHDAFFKHYLSQPAVAADFLRQYLPEEITCLLDWSQLRLEKDSFVDERLRSHFSDLIYTTVTKTATPVRIALLAEHKSYPDEWVAFQVLRYKVAYWGQEYEALQAELAAQRQSKLKASIPLRKTLPPILTVLVYHGMEAWPGPLRFARHLTGMEDPNSVLARAFGRYVPDFEPYFVNLSSSADAAIRGEVTTQMMVTVLKYIFTEELGGQLDEVLRLASEVFQQPSGVAMVMALLRYLGRSAVKVDKAALTQKLLTYLPHEGGVLMETLAQEWIQEGIDIGKKEGIAEGVAEGLRAQRQTLLQVLEWRFALSAEEHDRYAAQLAQVDDLAALQRLVNELLTTPTLAAFAEKLQALLPPRSLAGGEKPPV